MLIYKFNARLLHGSCALSGRGSAWLERLVRDQEVGGSNPLAPTTFLKSIPSLCPTGHTCEFLRRRRRIPGRQFNRRSSMLTLLPRGLTNGRIKRRPGGRPRKRNGLASRAGLIFLIVLLAVVQASSLVPSTSAQPQRSASANKWTTRDCKPASRSSKSADRKSKSKKSAASADSADSCLEVAAGSLEVQERLQTIVRENRWSLSEEDTDESSWTFSVQLTKDELVADTKPDSAAEQLQWTGGKASVFVQTTDLPDGYTRLTIKSRFDGFGESQDKFAPERAFWKLKSNGRLEASLIDALRTRLKNPS